MARRIQRTFRRMVIHKAYLHRKRDRLVDFAHKYVGALLSARVMRRTRKLADIRVRMWVKVQAAARGFVSRKRYQRVRTVVRSLKNATVRIQKFWRTVLAVGVAVEEVRRLRRLRSEAFQGCVSGHGVLVCLRGMAGGLYRLRDPRAGLKVTGLLHRLGELMLFLIILIDSLIVIVVTNIDIDNCNYFLMFSLFSFLQVVSNCTKCSRRRTTPQ